MTGPKNDTYQYCFTVATEEAIKDGWPYGRTPGLFCTKSGAKGSITHDIKRNAWRKNNTKYIVVTYRMVPVEEEEYPNEA